MRYVKGGNSGWWAAIRQVKRFGSGSGLQGGVCSDDNEGNWRQSADMNKAEQCGREDTEEKRRSRRGEEESGFRIKTGMLVKGGASQKFLGSCNQVETGNNGRRN